MERSSAEHLNETTVQEDALHVGSYSLPPPPRFSLRLLIDDLSLDILSFSFSMGGPIPSSPPGPK
jgi:hypothetical protein